MANPAAKLFNFYRRYKWTDQDFTDWQQGMVDLGRGAFEGLLGGAVLSGYAPTPSSMNISISAGVAFGSDGYMHVLTGATVKAFVAPGSLPRRDLVVLRKSIVDSQNITRPTDPFDTVPLVELQETQIVVIAGTPAASPAYPATTAGDVVLFGVRLDTTTASIADQNLDFEVRDVPGKNSGFQQNFGKYDDRFRPYRSSNTVVGIKPSQLSNPYPTAFSFVTASLPSIFPRSIAGLFNNLDALINFNTGAITGGDELTPDFTPTIPTAGNCIVATVSITSSDLIQINYGTTGTRAQCYAAIVNQATGGAGAINLPTGSKIVAFVLLRSNDGANITELDVFDARGIAASGLNTGVLRITANTTLTGVTTKCFADPTGGSFNVTLPLSGSSEGYSPTIKNTATGGANTVTVLRSGADLLEQETSIVLNPGDSVTLAADGVTHYWQVD